MRVIKYELETKFEYCGDEYYDIQSAYKVILERVKHIENAYL